MKILLLILTWMSIFGVAAAADLLIWSIVQYIKKEANVLLIAHQKEEAAKRAAMPTKKEIDKMWKAYKKRQGELK